MSSLCRRSRAALFVAAAAIVPLAQAHAAPCPTTGTAPLAIGTVAPIAAGAPRSFAIELGAREGVIVDLASVAPKPAADAESDGEDKPMVRSIRLCDGQGNLLAPQPGEVFEKGGSVTTTEEGERLRFFSTAAGRYIVSVAAGAGAREILVRRRDIGSSPPPIIAATLGTPQKGIASSKAPMVFSFAGVAGQWVQLKSTSEQDTVLRLAGPDRTGAYSVLAENDDSDGLNPMLRRKLPVTGAYFIQVDSLAEEPGEFDLTLARTEAPPPPAPATPLRLGSATGGKLADGDAVAMYALPVLAGHSYRLDLTAAYDGVVAIGVANPVEPDDGATGQDANFAEIKSQDTGTSGAEKLNFTARGNGQVLVRVRSFGIGETDGGYTLTATDLGG